MFHKIRRQHVRPFWVPRRAVGAVQTIFFFGTLSVAHRWLQGCQRHYLCDQERMCDGGMLRLSTDNIKPCIRGDMLFADRHFWQSFATLVAEHSPLDLLTIPATHLKVHRMFSFVKKGGVIQAISHTKRRLNFKPHEVCDGEGSLALLFWLRARNLATKQPLHCGQTYRLSATYGRQRVW